MYTIPKNITAKPGEDSEVPKVVRDGKVAVLRSDAHGIGWYTQHWQKRLLFDPQLVRYLEEKNMPCVVKHIEEHYPDVYIGSLFELVIEWVPVGALFLITEFDGLESVELLEEVDWIKA